MKHLSNSIALESWSLEWTILRLRRHGWSCRQIARIIGVSHLTVARWLRRGAGTPTAPPTVAVAPPPSSGGGAHEEDHA